MQTLHTPASTAVDGPAAPSPAAAPRSPAPAPEPPRRVLAIDWATVPLASDADADALWRAIAPTGADWDQKLDEIPVAAARPLARALLRGGNFTCAAPQPPGSCARPLLEVDPPAASAGLGDPCLRRLIALWSIAALEDEDVPHVLDALRAIAAIPPPESQLVAAAIEAIPEDDHARRLELLAIAVRAGQDELANGMVGSLDEPHLIEAATTHHMPGALEVLSADGHRATYLAAITDEALATRPRATAIEELVATEPTLPVDLRTALITATRSPDCGVAAAAARALALRGERRFVPVRPRTRSPATMMRALCVLAAYEQLRDPDDPSLLASFVPAKGLELAQVTFDRLGDLDADGDGDPRTARTIDLVPRDRVALPELEDLGRAFRSCAGTTCTSADREFRFGLTAIAGQLYLGRLEVIERPPCP